MRLGLVLFTPLKKAVQVGMFKNVATYLYRGSNEVDLSSFSLSAFARRGSSTLRTRKLKGTSVIPDAPTTSSRLPMALSSLDASS